MKKERDAKDVPYQNRKRKEEKYPWRQGPWAYFLFRATFLAAFFGAAFLAAFFRAALWTESVSDFAGLKATLFRAGMVISSPVRGLRALRLLTERN